MKDIQKKSRRILEEIVIPRLEEKLKSKRLGIAALTRAADVLGKIAGTDEGDGPPPQITVARDVPGAIVAEVVEAPAVTGPK